MLAVHLGRATGGPAPRSTAPNRWADAEKEIAMGLLQRFFGQRAATDATAVRRFESAAGKQAGAPSEPFIVFGHMADTIAQRIAHDTTMSCVAVSSLEALLSLLKEERVVGIRAQSRPEQPGEAQEAIRLFRNSGVPGATIYGAWDYNVDRAARRALECDADGIEMPGILTSELYEYLFGVLRDVSEGASPPTTGAEHEARLRKYTTEASPFWKQQDLIKSTFY